MIRDLSLALRRALQYPGFTAVVTLTLALGVGANTAVFTVFHSLLLRPLPWPDSHRVLNLWESNPGKGFAQAPMAAAQFVDLREASRSFAALAAWNPASVNLVQEDLPPERYAGALVTEDFFRVVGVQPVHGTGFAPDHFRAGDDAVVVLGHGVWRTRFGGDPGIVGQTVSINGRTRTVVGVLPAGFDTPGKAQFWVPKIFRPQELADRDYKAQRVFGRLADGVTLVQARAELETLFARLRAEHGDFLAGWTVVARPALDDVVQSARPALWLLLAAVATLLTMACLNLANLLLSRGVARGAELGLRSALGASRGRIARQLLWECLVLALPGGALGLLVAQGLLAGLLALAPATLPRIDQVRLDAAALAFNAAACLVTGLAFGFLPAWRLSATSPLAALQGGIGPRSSAAHGRHRRRLVILQVAATVVVLVVTGLLLRSFDNVLRQDLGFRPEGLWTARLELPPSRYGPQEQRHRFAEDLLERLATTPGVSAAAVTTQLPLQGWPEYILRLEERPDVRVSEAPSTGYAAVSPRYFATLGMPLRKGRDLSPSDDEDAIPVCVVNEAFARRHFGDRDAVGRRLEVGFAEPPRWLTVVGVVGDARNAALESMPRDQVFVPLRQQPAFLAGHPVLDVVVRAADRPDAIPEALRRAVRSIDPQQPVHLVRRMSEIVDQATGPRRFTVTILGIFAGVALLLAALGLYGVMHAAVMARRAEFGIRSALGAHPLHLVLLVLRFGVATLGLGLLTGVPLALGAAGLLRAMLYETSAWDPAAFGLAGAALAIVGLLAATRPAWTVARLDPVQALRSP